MRIAEINMIHVGSTGKIMFGIAETAASHGHEVYTFSPYYYQRGVEMILPEIRNHMYFGSRIESMIHYRLAEITGLPGFGSCFGTKQLIRKLKEIKPDILHLHSIHNYTVNLPMLFSYIKEERVKIIWTLHDCWAMTGKCPHFVMKNCQRWRSGCFHCPALHDYPKLYVDHVRLMWNLKRKWFTGIEKMILVTPSKWLADIVNKSYMSEYPVKVINNGIDLNLFNPVTNAGISEKYHIPQDKHIILGVAFNWDTHKGIDVFIELAERLPEDYQIVLVGTNDSTDRILPSQILSIHRTQNQKELAAIYSAADVLVNPTREDTFPTVNLEALACGLPVITFRTGGSPECIDNQCGICVECDDIDNLESNIRLACEGHIFERQACINRAALFDQMDKYSEYVKLYEKINVE